jgi:hypothetical protein
MWPIELGWLYDTFQTSSAHLEIGCFCGKSLFVTASAMGSQSKSDPPLCVVVDPLGYTAAGKSWESAVLQATIAEIHTRSMTKVEWWEMTSIDAMRVAHQRRQTFDSIFIDGGHHYAETKADIEGWLPFVRSGGIIAGHDYWPVDAGVMDAVCEVFSGSVETCPNSRIWWKRVNESTDRQN